MIKYLNEKKNCNISFATIDNSKLDSNAWLSGWLETKGCFNIYIYNLDRKYNNIEFEQTFTMTHKKIESSSNIEESKSEGKDNSYKSFLKKLIKLFNGDDKLSTKIKDKKEKYAISLKKQGLIKLFEYISQFNFFGKRNIDYLIFKNVFDLNRNIGQKIFKSITPKEYMEIILNSEKELNKKNIEYNFKELKKQAEKLPKFEGK